MKEEESRSILVTGGAGFIGSNLVRHLLSRGHRVLNVDLLTYAGNLSSLSDVVENPNYCLLRADIADSEAMVQAFRESKPDWVFHLAAESHVDRSISAPMNFVRTNVLGTASLLQAALDFWVSGGKPENFKFVHVSTDEVFGELGKEGAFDENSSYAPRSPYSASKAGGDHMVRAWGNTYGLPVIVTSCANNYGPYQFPEKLIPLTILNAMRGNKISVYGDGCQIRDWLHVTDTCKALELVGEKGIVRETYLIGAKCEWRNIDLVREICRIVDDLGREFPELDIRGNTASQIEFVADRLGHDFRYSIDPSKIENELGWTAGGEMSLYLEQTVRWYFENRDWWEPILDGSFKEI
ncbi:dTDP-glucose 4,6-dehydratase [Luteolibacter sp. AS25]|uniref:dTDP-glucose 4,6-dehydratase n=1 Tax=Luteolibacter sp. AS25 TaxID=3135776 RepID=UPI00398BAC1A